MHAARGQQPRLLRVTPKTSVARASEEALASSHRSTDHSRSSSSIRRPRHGRLGGVVSDVFLNLGVDLGQGMG